MAFRKCPHKHKLQLTFMGSHASCRRHSASDPHTVKNTAGIYKGGVKVPRFPDGNWQMGKVFCSNTLKPSPFYYLYILSTNSELFYPCQCTYVTITLKLE